MGDNNFLIFSIEDPVGEILFVTNKNSTDSPMFYLLLIATSFLRLSFVEGKAAENSQMVKLRLFDRIVGCISGLSLFESPRRILGQTAKKANWPKSIQ